MNHKKNLLIILLVSLVLTALGFYLDNDPPYANPTFLTSFGFEFFMMTVITFMLISLGYFAVHTIRGLFNRKKV